MPTRSPYVAPVLLSLIVFAYFVVQMSNDAVSEPEYRNALGTTSRVYIGGLPIRSAREGASDAGWPQGSSAVLDEFAGCLDAAASYSGFTSRSQPRLTTPPVDVLGYYTDVCLSGLNSLAWRRFSEAYGERPRAWVLQLLAAAENDFDRLKAEPGADGDRAWVDAFGAAPERIRALRRELLAVYGRAALVEDAAVVAAVAAEAAPPAVPVAAPSDPGAAPESPVVPVEPVPDDRDALPPDPVADPGAAESAAAAAPPEVL